MIEDEHEDDSGFRFDARRWTPRERIAGAASLVLLIALFLPWFGITLPGPDVYLGDFTGLQDGTLWITLVLIIVIVALLALRAGLGKVPFAPPPGDAQLLAGAAWLNFLVTLAAFLIKPGFAGQVPPGTVAIGWLPGAYLGLAAALVAAVASGTPRLRRLPGPPPRRGPGETRQAGDWRGTP